MVIMPFESLENHDSRDSCIPNYPKLFSECCLSLEKRIHCKSSLEFNGLHNIFLFGGLVTYLKTCKTIGPKNLAP